MLLDSMRRVLIRLTQFGCGFSLPVAVIICWAFAPVIHSSTCTPPQQTVAAPSITFRNALRKIAQIASREEQAVMTQTRNCCWRWPHFPCLFRQSAASQMMARSFLAAFPHYANFWSHCLSGRLLAAALPVRGAVLDQKLQPQQSSSIRSPTEHLGGIAASSCSPA